MLASQFLHALLAGDGLARTFAGAGVGAGALAADGQAAAMPQAPVAANIAEPGDVLLDLAAEEALDLELVLQQLGDAGDVIVAELAGAPVRVDVQPVADLDRGGRPDPVQVTQRNVRRLVR